MSTIVTCPHCKTRFRVTEEQLRVANGRVRCGACRQVFDARLAAPTAADIVRGLVEPPVEQPPRLGPVAIEESHGLLDGEPPASIDLSGPSVQNTQTDTPETATDFAGGEQTAEVAPAPKFRVIPPSPAARRRRVLGEEDLDAPLTQQERHNLNILLEAPEVESSRSQGRWRFAVVGLLALIGLVGQYLYFRWDDLANDPATRGGVETLCVWIGCEVAPFRDVQSIRSQVVLTEPTDQPDFVVVQAELMNQSEYAQGFPDLRVELSDRLGRVLVTRQFAPQDYRQGELKGLATLPSRRPVQIELKLLKPQTVVSSYRFEVVDPQG